MNLMFEKNTSKFFICLLLVIALMLPGCGGSSVQKTEKSSAQTVEQTVEQTQEVTGKTKKKGPHKKRKNSRLIPAALTSVGVGMVFPLGAACALGAVGASFSVPFALLGLPAIGLCVGLGAGFGVYKLLGKKR